MVILGSDQVTDPVTAAIELVKNAYDADASQAVVELNDLTDPESATITITDDGCGMTRDDIEGKWLSPAVSHRLRQKLAHVRTSRGRLPIGEKGVGRFSTNKLGRSLAITTRAAREPEQVLTIDWDQFDDDELFLDEIPIELGSRDPQIFKGLSTGTLLTITRLRERWNRLHVRALHRGLRRLQSPFRSKADFRVILKCPEYPEFEELDTSDVLDRAHYEFRGYINERGVLDYKYECRLPGIPARTHSDDANDIATVARERGELARDPPVCGPFYLNLYVWDRRADLLKAAAVTREELDDYCGISFFRDGLRVLPYGEDGDDWLNLNRERINDPSRRIGNNQVVGYVEVNQEDSPDLRDKTNREGLIDNEAFRDLRALVRAGVDAFTREWLQDRPKPEPVGTREGRTKGAARPAAGGKPMTPGGGGSTGGTSFGEGERATDGRVAAGNNAGSVVGAGADRVRQLRGFLDNLNKSGEITLSQALGATAMAAGLSAPPPGRYILTIAPDGSQNLEVTLRELEVDAPSPRNGSS
jgi:hypothetical protein